MAVMTWESISPVLRIPDYKEVYNQHSNYKETKESDNREQNPNHIFKAHQTHQEPKKCKQDYQFLFMRSFLNLGCECVIIAGSSRINGAEGLAFNTVVASGENSSMPHAVPTDRKIKYGDNTDLIENKYYHVLRTRDCIYFVYNEAFETWIPKEKKSFWLTWYSPAGLFEDIFLLPIVYVGFLPGFLSFLMSEGFDKIWGIIFSAVPGYLVFYDIYFKIKNK